MKSGTFKLSVGIVGFLKHETSENIEGAGSARSGRADVGFSRNSQKPDSEPDTKTDISSLGPNANDRVAWDRAVTPDSRRPLIPPEVRTKIEAIEPEARHLGWPAELLWNATFWDLPRGLAAVLDAEDDIGEVTADYIIVLKLKRNVLRFQRRHA